MAQQKIIIPGENEDDDEIPTITSKPKSGPLDKAVELFNKANTPYQDVSPEMKRAMDSYKEEHPIIGKIGEIGTGMVTGMTSPLSSTLGVVGGAAALAAKYGSPQLANALRIPGRVAAGGMVAHGGYRGIRSAMEGDISGAAGGALEGGLGLLGLRGLTSKGMEITEAPPVTKKQLALPPAKERLALPPGPNNPNYPSYINPEVAIEKKPRFIAGPAGVAQNRSYNTDLGPVNPTIGQRGVGTVLPRETEGLAEIPPDLAARKGLTIGDIGSPSEEERLLKNISQMTDEVQPRTGTGRTRLSETGTAGPDLPSGGRKPIVPDLTNKAGAQSNPLRNIGAGVKTITRPQGLPTDIEPPPITPDIKPTEAVQRWGWGRNAGRFSSNQVKEQFADLADKPDMVGKFQQGDRSGALAKVASYFDDRFSKLVKAGVLDPQQYKENYLKQLWENDPEEVAAVFKKSRILKKPGLSKESVFESYQEGIDAGLTPKYNNIADIAGAFEKEFVNAIRDKELYDYFIKNKMLPANKSLVSPFEWRLTGADAPNAAKMIQNYFSRSPEGLHGAANIVSGTKNLALTQGFPYRTGQISAHGYNVLESDIMASGVKKGLSNYFKGSVDPNVDVQFMKQNASMTKKLIEHGMNWADIEDHSALTLDRVNTFLDKIPGVGRLNVARRTMFEDPLFRVHLPATKLRMAIDRYNQLVPKVGETAALKGAASFSNDFVGGVDKTFRNKTYQDIARLGLLAPDWLESRVNIALKGFGAKGITGRSTGTNVGQVGNEYTKAALRGTGLAALPVVSGIAAKGLSNYLGSKPSESTGVNIGSTEGKSRNIEPLGTAVEPQRSAIQIGTQLSQGNLDFPFRYLGNKASPPAQTGMNLIKNVDPFGNPLSGKDRFGKPISGTEAALNMGQEFTRPITPSLIEALLDYYRGKAPLEESITRGLGLPVTYASEPKPKKTSSALSRLK